MTNGVVSLRPDKELGDFFDYIWEEQVGYVYAPLKNPSDNTDWETHFFEWPRQRSELIEHVLSKTSKWECYYGPSLYNQPTEAILENIKGSNVIWAEFDGNAPTSALGDKIPHASMRIQSSNEGHEHLYWKLDAFESDRIFIETINRSIAYTLSADTSGWDATQILRPPTTKNHKRDGKVVRTISTTSFNYSRDFFGGIPVPKQLVKEAIEIDDVPDALDVVARYKWDSSEFAFFRKQEIPQGSRSSALMHLAYTCCEMRMADEEAYSIMLNADERWGKFKGRRDQSKRLLDMINRARLKYPLDADLVLDDFVSYSWTEILELEIHIEWMIPGILQRQGLMLVSGPPGVGKTQFCLQFLMKMSTGEDMFDWKMDVPRKTVFFSMEMTTPELKYIMQQMDAVVEPEQRELLKENFQCVPIGYGVLMDTEVDQLKIRRYIELVRPDCIVFDSLSVTTNDELSDERTAKRVMDFANHLRAEYDLSVVFIHHNRKAQATNKKPKTLADVYGSQFLTSQPTTVITMWRDEKTDDIEILFPKVRLAEQPRTKIVQRHKGLVFKEIEPSALIKTASKLLEESASVDETKPEADARPSHLQL